MRFKNGAPLQVYVAVEQDNGDLLAASIHQKAAKIAATELGPKVKVFTYVLKQKKS
jgi:hypothetical protein